MSKHTPGEWNITRGPTGRVVVVFPNGITIDCGDAQIATNRANARLIAAAPDLLEALEGLLEYEPPHCPCGSEGCNATAAVWARAHATLAKAKGGSRQQAEKEVGK